jgi:uncharacterized protein YdhG (YjbR/CyaY superfamily)
MFNLQHKITSFLWYDNQAGDAACIDDCIAAQASAVQPILQRILAIVREEAPDAKEAISYRFPAFMQGGALIHFAAFRSHAPCTT